MKHSHELHMDDISISVSRCWNKNSLSREAMEVTVTVLFNMSETGFPVPESIKLIDASGGSNSAIKLAYKSARRAILICGSRGFDLPEEKYDHWRTIEMVFVAMDETLSLAPTISVKPRGRLSDDAVIQLTPAEEARKAEEQRKKADAAEQKRKEKERQKAEERHEAEKKKFAQRNNAKNAPINHDALTVKGISVGMSVHQSKNRLIERGYTCVNNANHYACYSGNAEIIIGENGIDFSCENFNLCGYKLHEAAGFLNAHFQFPSGIHYNPEISLMLDEDIPRYCGRGKAGDILCVRELPFFIPITVTLRKGSITDGGVSFD